MKNAVKSNISTNDETKIVSMVILITISLVIIISGLFLSIYSLSNNLSFNIGNNSASGFFGGLLVLSLGICHFMSIQNFING